MKNRDNPLTLQECKIKASILLKNLRSDHDTQSKQATKRFKCLAEFADNSNEEIKTKAKRKHALAVIAIENGYASWVELKNSLDTSLAETFVDNYVGGFLNKWFVTYESAKTEQKASGGFLLPYKTQFFICDENYIKALGLNPNDTDWQAIERDWVRPTNQKAFQRLNKKWLAIKKKTNDT